MANDTVLMQATEQWSKRPADERYSSLEALDAACRGYRERARTARVSLADLHAKVIDGAVYLNGRTDRTAALTHWSFGQLSRLAEAPPSYLRTLPASLAADCINTGLAKQRDDDLSLLFDVKGDAMAARAITTPKYSRIWNTDITSRLIRLANEGGWQPAPEAFDGSRGLYASQQDIFAFMVDNDRRIFETLPGGGLGRGFFVWNSEVGAASFGICKFLYEYVCGNHRVWGAQQVAEIRIRHIGDAPDRAFSQIAVELRKYADESAADDESRIRRCMLHLIGQDKDAVLDAVFGLRLPSLGRRRIEEAYSLAEANVDRYGDPRSAWGLAGGITQLARDLPHADARVDLDRAAGKVMEMAF